MSKERTDEEYDRVIAIWLFSGVKPKPYAKIAYQSIKHRWSLKTEQDAKDLINKYKVLFVPGVIKPQLRTIKKHFTSENGKDIGIADLPAWLRNEGKKNEDGSDIGNEADQKIRRQTIIDNLTEESFFSCQVRFNDDSEVALDEVIKWGIEHIERLRAAEKEKNQAKRTAAKDFGPIAIALVAVVITGATSYFTVVKQEEVQKQVISAQETLQTNAIRAQSQIQTVTAKNEKNLKYYETGFEAKQTSYAAFLRYLDRSFKNATQKNPAGVRTNLLSAEHINTIWSLFLNRRHRKNGCHIKRNFSAART